ncbi:hypothetical protein GTQ40_13705 [Flavobacteriaceae bacterium R38]|nr:hypothetical protein [Flavobacteriaceae bacterium R38]
MKKPIFIVIILVIFSCSTIKNNEQKQQLSTVSAELGAIGINNSGLLGNQFQQIGVPELSKKIRIQATHVPFDKASYKKYSGLIKKSGQINTVMPQDSVIQDRPKYLKFVIADLITLTEAMNAPENKAIQAYLDNDSNYKIISAVDVVTSKLVYNDILEAEEIYLSQHNANKLGLELMKDGKLYKKINLSSFTPFKYNLSSFCWGNDERRRPCIRAIVAGNISCPKDTYKQASKLDKKNDFKF